MQEFTVIDKISLDKVNIKSGLIKLDKASIIQTKLHKEDVAELIQDGDNLIIKLKNGETITIENYFVKDEAGNISDLVLKVRFVLLKLYFGKMVLLPLKKLQVLKLYFRS